MVRSDGREGLLSFTDASTDTSIGPHPARDRGGGACRLVGDVEGERFRNAASGADRRRRLGVAGPVPAAAGTSRDSARRAAAAGK